MKKCTVVIPTRNRLEKLLNTLRSIPLSETIDALIICDADESTYDALNRGKYNGYDKRYLIARLSKEHLGSVGCRNSVMRTIDDGVLYATDDIIFLPGAIERAVNTFNRLYPDDDGVVGITQIQAHHPSGMALVGSKFLCRYPQKKLFYPGYYHFAAQEIYWLAKSLGKFYADPDATVDHFHPAHKREYMDTTHVEARIHRKRDHDLIKEREAKGLIWGAEN